MNLNGSVSARVWRDSAIGLALPAILISVFVLAPFYNKAFTIDDPIFLHAAVQSIVNPAMPGAYDVVWDKDVPLRASAGSMVTGPIGGYLLVPSVLLGGSEPAAHLVAWLLLCCAAVATCSLALRLGYCRWRAAVAAALLVSAPAVLAMASTNMPDLPAMAFGVMSAERYFAWKATGKSGAAIAATVLLTIAILTRSHMLLLIGVLAMPCLIRLLRRDGDESGNPKWWWLPLAGAPVIAVLFLWVIRDPSPTAQANLAHLPPMFHFRQIPGNIVAFGLHWVLAFPLGIAWTWLHWRSIRGYLLAGLPLAFFVPLPPEVPRWAAVVATIGFLVIFDVFLLALKKRDSIQFTLGLWLLMGVATFPYVHHPAKYELPAAPAAAILIAGTLPAANRRTLAGVAAVCATGIVLGAAIIHADAVLSGLGRQMAADVIRPAVAAGNRVWFAGHWGFQWYAEQAGARPITEDAPWPIPGDLVLWSSADRCHALEYVPQRKLLRSWTFDDAGGRVMSGPDQAGFYSSGWGYLPWSWGSGTINHFELWKVE